MRISVFGAGYVGLVQGTCLANLGNDVLCCDIDEDKVASLRESKVPFFEPGLGELVELNVREGRLKVTTSAEEAVTQSELIFIAVGTPQDDEGRANLNYVLDVAASIGQYMNDYKLVVTKSTVPVGTADKVKEKILASGKDIEFDVASNPEFLRQGAAVRDFMNPDRIVIGADSERARKVLTKLYRGVERSGRPIINTDIKSAELTKYAANAMLAMRISFMNMLAPLCEKSGADVKSVAHGMGMDNRIGPRFLQAGIGYGGSCFPKDIRALIATLADYECKADLLQAADDVNERAKRSLIPKLMAELPDIKDKKIAMWGLSFKPKTDDMRQAPSLVMARQLSDAGARIVAFDPVAENNARSIFTQDGIDVQFVPTPYEALKGCEALVICTEWDEFRFLDYKRVKSLLKNPIIADGRNMYDVGEMASLGLKYICIGRG
ncbi:UDP-glucose dehydrogenase family protein [Candidatus Hydrogenedentota bacterium]